MFGFRDQFHYLECAACGCLQLLDSPADMGRYYPPNYYSFAPSSWLQDLVKQRWAPLAAWFQDLVKQRWAAHAVGQWSVLGWLAYQLLGPYESMIAIHRANIPLDARVLDVGCGSGRFIRDMRAVGYQRVAGLDPYIDKDLQHPHGVTVFKRQLWEMDGQFDVLMLHHSFEHMADPSLVLRELGRLLAQGGRILLRIPVAGSFAWRRYGINWIGLDAPRHLFLHTARSIELLAAAAGLRVSSVVFESNATQFLGSEQYERDIPLADRRSVYSGGPRRWIGWWRARRLRPRIAELNRSGQGDWACFELRAADLGAGTTSA